MRYHTKEYYTLMMAFGRADGYEPVVDMEYTDEDIEELYQKAQDRYIEEERADYDEPPVLFIDEDEELDEEDVLDFEEALEEYENREPFDEDEAREEFEEMYRDNLEDPDEDLPAWVREAVDPRILAMNCMPEKIFRKLTAEDEANEERFDFLDERADEAFEELRETLPGQYVSLMDLLEEFEDADVIEARLEDGLFELVLEGWDDEGDEAVRTLRFIDAEVIEDEGISPTVSYDEDGDPEYDCELLYSEIYMEDGRPEVHMMFENNGLKYLTFRCSEAQAVYRLEM